MQVQPSAWARALGHDWTVEVDGPRLRVTWRTGQHTVPAEALRQRVTTRSWPGSSVTVPGEANTTLGGLGGRRRTALETAIGQVLGEADRLDQLRAAFTADAALVQRWREGVLHDLQRLQDRWISREVTQRWVRDRPHLGHPVFEQVRVEPELAPFLDAQPPELLLAIETWERDDLPSWVRDRNTGFLEAERVHMKGFFDEIEKSPLTHEQVTSVVMCDNRVQVIASAGSGKTSTMVARAGYALERGIASAENILMLAYNRAAATELGDRVVDRLGARGLDGKQITAATFHGFGLSVIGQATGAKPRVASDVASSEGARRMEQVVDQLRDTDPTFRQTWDLFRLVFGQALPDFGSPEEFEDWDSDKKSRGYKTLKGEIVKSQEERLIANWLFYHGVRYEYERPYEIATATPDHSQYQPDFYYPDIDAYHEHWGIDRDGNPPPHFKTGYLDGMRWKLQLHQDQGTTLLQTTSATIRDGSGFDQLAHELTTRGLTLDTSYHEVTDIPGRAPTEDQAIMRLLRQVLAHVKSNQLSTADLRDRAHDHGRTPIRTELFLRLFEPVQAEWQRRLVAANEVDFDDMLNRASDLIEDGQWNSPYTLVLVDEMQDSSAARARLVRAITNAPDRYLLAVGDDWQSINRFAGADLSIMTDFGTWFGEGPSVQLTQTFRSPQSLCDIAGHFVTKNPNQIAKQVVSAQTECPPTLTVVAAENAAQYATVLREYLKSLEAQHADDDNPATVYIMARYKDTLAQMSPVLRTGWKKLTLISGTIHGSKGREADHVVVVDVVSGRNKTFPATMIDDPLLTLAQPQSDRFPDADERRLLYVALTRARKSTTVLTTTGRESTFIVELVQDHDELTVQNPTGDPVSLTICPQCKKFTMTKKTNAKDHSVFYSCNDWPRCNGTRRVKTAPTPTQ